MVSANGVGGYAYGTTNNRKSDFLDRVPYPSLIALTLVVAGVSIYCTMIYRSTNSMLQQLRHVFKAEITWLDKVQITVILLGVIMGVVALILLIVGALSTGTTRTQIYAGWKARVGGRISCALFLVLTYCLYLCWMALFTLTAVLAFIYWLFIRICDPVLMQPAQEQLSGVCVSFDLLAPILNGTTSPPQNGKNVLTVCDTYLSQFCTITNGAYTGFFVSYAACAVVLLGLIHYMICLASNYVHIKDGFKYFELEEIRMNEENDLAHYGTRGPGNFRM